MRKELDPVVLTSDVPEHGLKSGDIGTVVMIHRSGAGFEVEFVTLDGQTIAVATLPSDKVRPVGHGEIPQPVKSRTPDRIERHEDRDDDQVSCLMT